MSIPIYLLTTLQARKSNDRFADYCVPLIVYLFLLSPPPILFSVFYGDMEEERMGVYNIIIIIIIVVVEK